MIEGGDVAVQLPAMAEEINEVLADSL
jgi:hypothetical protein